jgi:hypothetical protein
MRALDGSGRRTSCRRRRGRSVGLGEERSGQGSKAKNGGESYAANDLSVNKHLNRFF